MTRSLGLAHEPIAPRRRRRVGAPARPAAAVAGALAGLLGLGACGGGSPSSHAGGAAATPAAVRVFPLAPEPAVSPPLSATPAGRLVALPGGAPEGVAVDARTHLAAVALRDPARVALVDVGTGRLVRTVAVAGAARHLQLAAPGGPVLVPEEPTDTVAELGLPAGTVARSTRVGRQPHDAAAASDGRVVVADELGGAVTVLDAGRTVATFLGPVQPGGVATVGTLAGVVDVGSGLLWVFDAATPALVGTVRVGDGPSHAVADGRGHVVVADTRGGALVVTALGPRPAVLARVPLPGRPYGLAVDTVRHRLWVTVTATNRLVGFDIAPSGALTRVADLPTVRQPNSVGVDDTTGRVVVAGAVDAQLELVDP